MNQCGWVIAKKQSIPHRAGLTFEHTGMWLHAYGLQSSKPVGFQCQNGKVKMTLIPKQEAMSNQQTLSKEKYISPMESRGVYYKPH